MTSLCGWWERFHSTLSEMYSLWLLKCQEHSEIGIDTEKVDFFNNQSFKGFLMTSVQFCLIQKLPKVVAANGWIPYLEYWHLHHAQWETGMYNDDPQKLQRAMESIHPLHEKQIWECHIMEILCLKWHMHVKTMSHDDIVQTLFLSTRKLNVSWGF